MTHPAPNPVPSKPPIGLFGGNVLVAAPSQWDEACFSAPAVRAIRLARPTCTLGIVCSAEQVEYWKSIGQINRIISFGADRSYREILREQLRSNITWESAILWEKNEAAALAVDLKVKQRLGFPSKNLRKWLTDQVYVEPIHGAPEHRVQHYLRFMDRLNIPVNHPKIFQPISTSTQGERKGLLISPESDYGVTYEWSEDRWRDLFMSLREKIDVPITLINHPGSKTGLAERIAQNISGVELTQIASIGNALNIALDHSIAVCADSSICHVAAHAGATVITLFGPGAPHWRRPLGKQHLAVRRKVECNPCFLTKCPMDLRCQKELSVEMVATAILQKYDQMQSMIG